VFKRTVSFFVLVGIFSGLFSSPAQAVANGNVLCSGGGYFIVSNNKVVQKAPGVSGPGIDCVGTAVIPDGVTEIEDYGFNGQQALTDIVIPDSVTKIGANGIAETGLTRVILPAGLTELRQGALGFNWNLTSLVIPASVINIQTNLVFGASGLCDVYFLGSAAPQTAVGAFNSVCASGSPKAFVQTGATGFGLIGSMFYGLQVQNGGSILLFDANGAGSGNAPSTQVLTPGSNFQFPTNAGSLTRTGFRFNGWCNSKAGEGSGQCYAVGEPITVADGTTIFYANWQGKPKVTYDANGATSGSVPVDPASPYEENSTVTVLGNTGPLTRTGYEFAGWTTASNGGGTFLPAGETFNIQSSNATLFAKWTPKRNTVTYESNGGTSVINGSFLTGGQIAYAPAAPTRQGYFFAGWSATNGGSIESFPYSPPDLGDITLYAKWTIRQFSVYYTGNGSTSGSGMGPNPHNFGSLVVVRANENNFQRTGYDFAGWNTRADGNGENRPVASTFTIGADNVELFAKWTVKSFVLDYNGNGSTGGDLPAVPTSHNYNSFVPILYSTLTKTGYKFAGWNTHVDGSGTQYGYPAALFMPANSVTLYAQWSNSGTLTYSGNANTSGSVPVDAEHNFGSPVTVSRNSGVLAKSGYKFVGWNTAADGTGTSYDSTGSDTFEMPESDVTLYAVWEVVPKIDEPDVDEPDVVNPVPTAGTYVFKAPVDLPRFITGSTVLTNACKAAIKKVFKNSGSEARFIITGVAGMLPGVTKANVELLAAKRAAKVKTYLLKLGVKASNITIKTKITKINVVPKTSIISKILTK